MLMLGFDPGFDPIDSMMRIILAGGAQFCKTRRHYAGTHDRTLCGLSSGDRVIPPSGLPIVFCTPCLHVMAGMRRLGYMTFRKFRYYAYIVLTIVGVVAVMGLAFREACVGEPPAAITIGVQAEDFSESTFAAMGLMNGFVGCEFLVPGDDVVIKSDNGEPCGIAFHPAISDGHSAGAYRCADGKSEVLVSAPGDIHTQVCIVAHEIGHVAGLKDAPSKTSRGIMNQYVCPDRQIVLSDAESKYLSDKFCAQ